MLILQALAYQMCQEATQALDALSEAVRLAKPEGYIRSFVDEGASMDMLYQPFSTPLIVLSFALKNAQLVEIALLEMYRLIRKIH